MSVYEKVIRKVVKGISVGQYFDVHYVADKIFREGTRGYYRLVRSFPNINQAVLVRKIGTTLKQFPECELVKGESISYNIHGNANPVRLFKKIS